MALQMSIKNLQGKVNNLKSEVANLKNSGHPGAASTANKDNRIITPRWKQEVQAHQPTWWITTYCWIRGEVGHSGADCMNKRPGNKAESTEATRLGGSAFGLPQVL